MEGEENAIIVYQLNQRRALPGFAHCQGRVWEGLRWPGLVSPGQGGRNLIQGLAGVTPPTLPFAALGSSDADRRASVLGVQGDSRSVLLLGCGASGVSEM